MLKKNGFLVSGLDTISKMQNPVRINRKLRSRAYFLHNDYCVSVIFVKCIHATTECGVKNCSRSCTIYSWCTFIFVSIHPKSTIIINITLKKKIASILVASVWKKSLLKLGGKLGGGQLYFFSHDTTRRSHLLKDYVIKKDTKEFSFFFFFFFFLTLLIKY